MSLEDAIIMNILNKPTYISSIFYDIEDKKIQEKIEKAKIDIETIKDEEERKKLKIKYEDSLIELESNNDIKVILKDTLINDPEIKKKKNVKFIIFAEPGKLNETKDFFDKNIKND